MAINKNQISILFSLLLSACASQVPQEAAKPAKVPKNAGSIIYFEETTSSDGTVPVRMLITRRFLRLDDGKDSDDYVLFDRMNKIIYNVVNDDQTVMVMNSVPPKNFNVKMPKWKIQSQPSNALMRSDSKTTTGATYYKLSLSDKECYNVVTLNNILGDESKALQEYYVVLSNELKKSYHPSADSACFDAVNILDPKKRYSMGFPYREWSSYGYQRFLQNYQQRVIFPESLFDIPKNYHRY